MQYPSFIVWTVSIDRLVPICQTLNTFYQILDTWSVKWSVGNIDSVDSQWMTTRTQVSGIDIFAFILKIKRSKIYSWKYNFSEIK